MAPPPSQPYVDDAARAGCSALFEARELGAAVAGLGKRSLAFAIDTVIGVILFSPAIVCLVMLIQGHAASWPWPMLLMMIGAALLTIFQIATIATHGLKGVTAGKAMLGLRSVSVREHRKPGFWRIVLRTLVLSVSALVPILGPALMFSSSLFDPLKAGRSWLDRVADCWVIDISKGLNPRDTVQLLAARRQRDLGHVSTTERLVPLGSWAPEESVRSVISSRSYAGVVGFAGALAGWQTQPRQFATASGQATPRQVGSTAATRRGDRLDLATSAASPLRLLFDDGSAIEVPPHGVIGRSPEAVGEFVNARLLRLRDDARSISKAHLEIGFDELGCWVRDLGSANGTDVAAPDADAVRIAPGERHYLVTGTVVQLGARRFTLLRGDDEGAQA